MLGILQDDGAQAQQSSVSVASTTSLLSQIETHEDDVWMIFKTELLAEDVSMAHIMSNKEEIIEHIKSLVAGGLPNGGYEVTPGQIYGSIANSSASSASEPLAPNRGHIRSPDNRGKTFGSQSSPSGSADVQLVLGTSENAQLTATSIASSLDNIQLAWSRITKWSQAYESDGGVDDDGFVERLRQLLEALEMIIKTLGNTLEDF
ncbi:hypothetical protein HO173_000121 [Letharia columbiana]|uniref:Uncharacterized protein n=1 Tax=Letharia columbiana TaxID=112416 RepID=A0A8H6G6G6_9LECA|nr:uncharacterized protein HO173_000121 [Letharia columbiana]KAF6241411.1 hypothetical protein HO173_000121 [Letharia columbiana]